MLAEKRTKGPVNNWGGNKELQVTASVPHERLPRFASSPSSKEKKGEIIISLFVEK